MKKLTKSIKEVSKKTVHGTGRTLRSQRITLGVTTRSQTRRTAQTSSAVYSPPVTRSQKRKLVIAHVAAEKVKVELQPKSAGAKVKKQNNNENNSTLRPTTRSSTMSQSRSQSMSPSMSPSMSRNNNMHCNMQFVNKIEKFDNSYPRSYQFEEVSSSYSRGSSTTYAYVPRATSPGAVTTVASVASFRNPRSRNSYVNHYGSESESETEDIFSTALEAQIFKELYELPSLKAGEVNILQFATKLKSSVMAFKTLQLKKYLSCPDLLKSVINKLPYDLRTSYNRHMDRNYYVRPPLEELGNYIFTEAEIAVKAGRVNCPCNKMLKSTEDSMVCYICDKHHMVKDCPRFLRYSVPRRWDNICRFRLCFRCLKRGHKKNSCKELNHCTKCFASHHTLLHQSDNRYYD